MLPEAEIACGSYTNHAGLVQKGIPIKVETKYVTISNANDVVRLPFSIFPERERRRLAADGGSLQFVPQDVRRAVEGHSRAMRRAQNRLNKGLAKREDHDRFAEKSQNALKLYLDRAEQSGKLLPSERRLLVFGY